MRGLSLLSLFLAFAGFSELSLADGPTEEWVSTQDGGVPGEDKPASIVIDSEKNIYVSSRTSNVSSASASDILTVKIGPNGQEIWRQVFNGASNGMDDVSQIALDSEDNLYVAGQTFEGSVNRQDFLLIKYSKTGQELWHKTFNGPLDSDDVAHGVAVSPDGYIYVTGSAWMVDWQGSDFYTMKYDTNGNVIWQIRHNCQEGYRASNDEGRFIGFAPDGGVYVGGYCSLWPTDNDPHAEDFALLKYSREGVLVMGPIAYNGPYTQHSGTDLVTGMAVGNGGEVYLTGRSQEATGWKFDLATVKISNQGQIEWVSRYSGIGTSNDLFSTIKIDPQGNPIITGVSDTGPDIHREDIVTIKYDKNTGATIWQNIYDGNSHGPDLVNALVLDNAGNAIVSGYTIDMGGSDAHQYSNASGILNALFKGGSQLDSTITIDYLAIKYTNAGAQEWVTTYDGNGENLWSLGLRSLFDPSTGAYYLTGASYTGQDEDVVTIKYSSVTGVQVNTSLIPSTYVLSQNYPNPFNPTTTISYDLPRAGKVELRVMDVTGRMVATLVNGIESAGKHSVSFDASSLPSGVYFYSIVSGEFSDQKKMILLK